MVNIGDMYVGRKVHYQPSHYSSNQWENGIVKEVREGRDDGVWVVYSCNEKWDDYMNYTGALTNLCDLKLGWK